MNWLTVFVAYLIGYYYEQCPVCGRGIAILNDGRIVSMCSRRIHARARDEAPR